MHQLALLALFYRAKWQIFLPFPILELGKSLPFYPFYILARTFQAEPPRIGPRREYPPPPPRAVCDCFKNTGDNCTPIVLQYSFLEKV